MRALLRRIYTHWTNMRCSSCQTEKHHSLGSVTGSYIDHIGYRVGIWTCHTCQALGLQKGGR